MAWDGCGEEGRGKQRSREAGIGRVAIINMADWKAEAGRGMAQIGKARNGEDGLNFNRGDIMEKKRIFKAKGLKLTEEKAGRYGLELLRLREKANGCLETRKIVDAARPQQSPLHDHFIWDDSKAAEAHRRQQARTLASSIYEVRIEDDEEKEVKLFYNVTVQANEENQSQGYVQNFEVMENADYRDQKVQEAISKIKHWQEQYKMLTELDLIFGAIGKTQKKLNLEMEKRQ